MAGTRTMRLMTRLRGSASIATRLTLMASLLSSVAACAGVPDVLQGLDGSATARQLNGPWRPQPMRPAAALVAEADRVCRRDISFEAGLPLLVVDARGVGRLQLLYASADGKTGECQGIFVRPDGSVRGGGPGGSSEGDPWQPIPRDGLEIITSGSSFGTLGEDETHRAGRAGPGVAHVRLTVVGVPDAIEATLANGWWSAWWPGSGACHEVVALAADGSVLDTVTAC
jgi:hypothetical protein